MRFNGKIISAMAAASLLAACVGGDSGGSPLSTEQIASIKAATELACSFVPTAITIAAATPTTAPYAVPASAIAKAICDAVSKQGAAIGDSTVTAKVTVDGKETIVAVKGYFVPKVTK